MDGKSNQRKRVAVYDTEEAAKNVVSGSYKAYRVTNTDGRTLFAVAINPLGALGAAA